MEIRLGVLMAFVLLAATLCMPAADAASLDPDQFPYLSQLDDDELQVAKTVAKATSVESESKEFTIALGGSMTFDDQGKAKEYADSTVQNGLAAEYLSDPMVPYLWDYPVKKAEVDATVKTVKVIDEGGIETVRYIVDRVTFTLTVPEGITQDSMDSLNAKLSSITISGSTDASKVSSIISYLDKLSYQKDGEGEISNIYDALVGGKSSSAGVAQAFTQLCKQYDITAITVAGTNILAEEDEAKSFWNYVYLEGDVEKQTVLAWYIVDSAYAASTGIAGYLTSVSYDGSTYSMAAAHSWDLTLSSPNDLSVPQLTKEKYVPVGGPAFFDLYGEYILIGLIGVVIVGAMVYALRSGNF